MTVLALDVGGANLKAADGLGYAATRPFALWQTPERLADELGMLLAAAPGCERLAATMTGELADCYETKAAGVRAIVEALETAAAGRPLGIYLTDGRLATACEACDSPLLAGASNWHALGAFAARFVASPPGVLLDMGSTTTDVIPLGAAGPAAVGRTDPERLASGELVYTGVERTPASVIVNHFMWRGRRCAVAAERFATAVDAYLTLGDLPEDPHNLDTADGRPRTRAHARARLARTICADATMFSDEDALAAAMAMRDAQLRAVEAGLAKVIGDLEGHPATFVLSGQGEFLLRRLVAKSPWRGRTVSLAEELGPAASRCAPAHALAVLVREGLGEAGRR